MTVRVVVSSQAAADIRSILAYTLEMWGRDQVDTYQLGLDGAFDRIARFPEIGHLHPRLGSDTVVSRFESHHIVYRRVSGDEIRILRVLHILRRLSADSFAESVN